MTSELARVNRIPWDWRLEVGSLAGVQRNYSPRRVCQIDITEQAFTENPMGTPLIPNWNRVVSAIPGIFDMLKVAVEEDNK